MKKSLLIVFLILSVSFALAQDACEVDVSILNQDPIPAVPGEEMEIVFVLSGIDSTDCGTIQFEVLDEFPFRVLEGSQNTFRVESGTFTKDYNTHKTIPVDFKVNENALDGDNPLEVRWKSSKSLGGFSSERFDINVEDVRADFEVFVSDYNYQTKEITFEVLNIGENDIEAVTVQVLNQEGITVYGANKENIGDLSSNEDTSSEFKMDINTNMINLVISYSDSINERRTVEKEVEFDSSLFESTKEVESNNTWIWIVVVIIVVIILLFFRKRRKKKKS